MDNGNGAFGLSRRDFLKISGAGLAGAALLGVAGCGGGGEGGQQGDGGGGGGNGGGGGGQFTIAWDQEPAILNNTVVGGDLVATQAVVSCIMESPLAIQPDLSYAPLLIEAEPEITSEDPFTIEFKFREGLTFSDGEPLTAADWVFTYEQITNEDNQIISREVWDSIESVETPDDLTVRVVFSEPDARWRDMLANNYPVFPRHVYEGENFNKAANDEIVGSGPYRFVEWRKGQNITLEANDNYWGEAPSIPTITWRFIPDTNALKAALRSGEVQFINPPPDIGLIPELEGYDGVTVQTAFGVVWEHLAFQLETVDNPNIRKAIAFGVNREQLINEILQGDAKELQSVLVPENGDYYTPAWDIYSFDPDEGRRLVQQAESEGASTEIQYSTTSGAALRETAQQVIRQQMEDIGITLTIDNSSAETFFGERTVEGDFEMGQWAWSSTPDPSLTTLFGANNLPPDGQNYYRYENEEATRLMEEADRTIDEAQRAELTRQVQELMADDCPLVPLYQRPEIYAYAEGLEGPEVNPTLATATWNIAQWTYNA